MSLITISFFEDLNIALASLVGSTLAWLQSYLSGRQQFARAGNASSLPTSCTSGVPQGSVLGPILFSCFTSPISSIASSFNINTQQYADDTQVFLALTPDSVNLQLSHFSACLNTLHSWFTFNGLSLNASKSEAILIGTHQRLSCCLKHYHGHFPNLLV